MEKLLGLTCLILGLSACAPSNETAPCERQGYPEMATYPDGQTLKSDVYQCSDGCTKYAWVSDESVSFNSCGD